MIKQVFSLIFILFNCTGPALIPAWEAQSQIGAAAEFRANKCQEECRDVNKANPSLCERRILPQPPLILFNDVQERNLNLCSIAITRTSCPLSTYPLACLLVYKKDNVGDIPWWVNFNQAVKDKFK